MWLLDDAVMLYLVEAILEKGSWDQIVSGNEEDDLQLEDEVKMSRRLRRLIEDR